jgi:hypothetical protein
MSLKKFSGEALQVVSACTKDRPKAALYIKFMPLEQAPVARGVSVRRNGVTKYSARLPGSRFSDVSHRTLSLIPVWNDSYPISGLLDLQRNG